MKARDPLTHGLEPTLPHPMVAGGRRASRRRALAAFLLVVALLISVVVLLYVVLPGSPPSSLDLHYSVSIWGPVGRPLTVLVPAVVFPNGTLHPLSLDLAPTNETVVVRITETSFGPAVNVSFTERAGVEGQTTIPRPAGGGPRPFDQFPGGIAGLTLWMDFHPNGSGWPLGDVRVFVSGLGPGEFAIVGLALTFGDQAEQYSYNNAVTDGWSTIEVWGDTSTP